MKTHKPIEGQSTGSGHLSVEQMRRMEENRRKAREKLAAKRLQHPPSSNHSASQGGSVAPRGDLGPPPAKRPAMTNPQYHFAHHKQMLRTTGYHGNQLSTSQNTQPQQIQQSSQSSTHQTPITSTHICSVSEPRTFPPAVPPLVPRSRSQAATSTSMFYTNPSSTVRPSAVSQTPQLVKFAQLQAKIKANMVLISRARFKVAVPYDSTVIELFKKMATKSYGMCYHNFLIFFVSGSVLAVSIGLLYVLHRMQMSVCENLCCL